MNFGFWGMILTVLTFTNVKNIVRIVFLVQKYVSIVVFEAFLHQKLFFRSQVERLHVESLGLLEFTK